MSTDLASKQNCRKAMLNCLTRRSFLLPSDLQLELENWTETGEFDRTDLHEVCLVWSPTVCVCRTIAADVSCCFGVNTRYSSYIVDHIARILKLRAQYLKLVGAGFFTLAALAMRG